jgi:hypothetical protein
MLKSINDWQFVIMMSLLLGLAPFFPEPHILGKLRWVAGGGVGMKLMDWGDLLMHGLPWLLLIRLVILHIVKLIKPEEKREGISRPGK